jgi:hypothetical protein
MAVPGAALLRLSYAKNERHEQFVLGHTGQLKGRYNVAFLVGSGILGGAELRASLERELGNPKYGLEDWCPVRDAVYIFDRMGRAGVSFERVGELVLPAYKRAHPQEFEGRNVLQAFEILEAAYRRDTTYGGVSPGLVAGTGRATVYRQDSPLPCAYFVGVIKGLLAVFGSSGVVREVECQWEGAKSCAFETRWASRAAA